MKIDEDDLKKIFEKDHDMLSHEEKGERIIVKKTKSTNEIKRIRKRLKRFKHKKEKGNWGEFINSILRFLAICGFSGFILFIVIGWSGISKQLEWGYYVTYLNRPLPTVSTPIPPPTPTPIPSPKPIKTPTRTPVRKPTPTPAQPPKPVEYPKNNLRVSKLSVSANVVWDVEEDNIIEKLRDGVVHYKGTSHPGEGGNIFIVGHSSNYPWVDSWYNSVFALLDKLEPGDRIELSNNFNNYVYEVKSTDIVWPNEVQVLDYTSKETLSLMTCWPVGTSLKRLVVKAELLYAE